MLANLLRSRRRPRPVIADQEVQCWRNRSPGAAWPSSALPPWSSAGTVADNLCFGLKYRPQRPPSLEGPAADGAPIWRWPREQASCRATRMRSRSTTPQPASRARGDRWGGGARADPCVCLDRDVYQMGLRGTIDPERRPALAGRSWGPARPCAGGCRPAARPARRGVRAGPLPRQREPRENLLFGTPIAAESTPSASPPTPTSGT